MLGRGFNQATAFEWALNSKSPPRSWPSPLDCRLPPPADRCPGLGYPVLVIAARGPAIDDVVDVLDRCRQAGASLVVIGNDRRLEGMTPSVLQLDGDLDEWLSPIPAVVLGQLFAYHLTIARVSTPSIACDLHKVTRTT